MAVSFYDTSDQVLQYLHNTHSCLRSSIEEYFEKIYGRQSGVNPLSSIGQLVIDDLIEKTGNDFHLTPAGEDIFRTYGSYSAYRKSMEEKQPAETIITSPKDLPEKTDGGITVPVWVVVLSLAAIAAILMVILRHKR